MEQRGNTLLTGTQMKANASDTSTRRHTSTRFRHRIRVLTQCTHTDTHGDGCTPRPRSPRRGRHTSLPCPLGRILPREWSNLFWKLPGPCHWLPTLLNMALEAPWGLIQQLLQPLPTPPDNPAPWGHRAFAGATQPARPALLLHRTHPRPITRRSPRDLVGPGSLQQTAMSV